MKKKYYITTAIAYTSGKPHIGNTYEIVLTDLLARYKRMQGYDVYFQTGTDEHGMKIEEKAKAQGVEPQAFVDNIAGEIKKIWDLMNTSYDNFIRTTDSYHKKQVQKIFTKLYKQGDIYKGSYSGWYCTPCESFWSDSQLKDGKCPDCGREVNKEKEEAYFFNMQKYANRLIEYYEKHLDFITPISRKREMLNNFLKPGLQDLCVSRSSFKWGIPVEFDSKHVVYVWLDALVNYITGIGYDVDGESGDKYKKYWPADLHVIGKDIVRFHSIYWPIFLMALDLPLPKQIFGHPWLLQDGDKMSKSKNNVLYADDLVNLFGVDEMRYYLLSSMPQDDDGLISYDLITEKINSDLANVYGNLVSRVQAMINKYFDGVLYTKGKANAEQDDEFKNAVTQTYLEVEKNIDQFKVSDALASIMGLFRKANKYIDVTTPWILAKENPERLKTVLYNLTEAILVGTTLISPYMPTKSEEVFKIFNTSKREYKDLSKFGLIKNNHKISKENNILFKRLDIKEIKEKVTVQKSVEENNANVISIDDFKKVELKVGKILEASKVEKSEKLLKFSIDLNEEKPRCIVSGIAKYYKPEELIGKSVCVVTNLKPAKLCCIESQGMILCATNGAQLSLISPISEMPQGSEIS